MATNSGKSNRVEVPEAKAALERFKTEVASELGVNLKEGYRYNMHLKQRYLLIEMGAQTNTYEECMNSCVPLAQMLDLELSGKTDFTLDPEKG